MYYVTTNNVGQFTVNGDYTCTAGYPVYLYASGGNPSAPSPTQATIMVTGASSSITTPGYMGLLVVTFNTTGTNLLYQGESITFGTFTDPTYGGFSGLTETVASVNLTNSQFSVVLGASSTAAASSTFTTTVTQASAPSNNAIVNIAMLGLCPSTGAQNFSYLNFVFMNEISTVAAAYAMAPFASTTANNDALHIGTSSTNLVGLQNAALEAGKLYDIQGSDVGAGTDGEAHIARAATPDAAAGVVPQMMLNTLGNLLANCVDSANTYGVANTSGTKSGQCVSLFSTATSTGASGGTQPNDTATAAINIAHYPGGSASSSGFATTLYNGITGNVPFQPYLGSAPHDFLVGIVYATPSSSGISDVETDANGNVWTLAPGLNAVLELQPSGSYLTYSPPTGSTLVATTSNQPGIAIDKSGNVYAPAAAGVIKFVPGNATGTLIGAANSGGYGGLAVDGLNNLYVANINPVLQTSSYLAKESLAGVAAGGNYPIISACSAESQYVEPDASNNVWTNQEFTVNNRVCRYTSAGVLQYSFYVPGAIFPLSYGLAIDNGGNAWFSEKDNGAVFKLTAGITGTFTTGLCTVAAGCTQATGGTLNTTFGAAVDGANNVWVTNAGTSISGTTYSSLVPYSNAAVALTPTYLIGTGYGTNLLALQNDVSGNLWATSYSANNLVNFVGVGAPTAMPLSVARATNTLGAKP
jgi:streptogramin lyase